MKNILLSIIILFLSCKSTKNLNFTVQENIFIQTENCPDNGTCSIELIPNQALKFNKDEFGNSYPVITEGEKTILKYTYTKNPATNTQDSKYTEIVYAELERNTTPISLTNKELQTIKLYFGRLCYCKGQTGYYPIKNGAFKLEKLDENTMKIEFEFKISEVPQVISKINETISLKSN